MTHSNKELRESVYDHLYAIWSADDMDRSEFNYRYSEVMQLFTQAQLQLLSELKDGLPERKHIDWCPSENCHFNNCLVQVTAQINNLMKGLRNE